MSTLQIQARALGDPTRHDIFRHLADADGTVDVAELAARFALNHNAVRQHLAKLVDADLVVESSAAPTGRGRPRLLYALHPAVESRWGVTGPYERLAMLLTEVVRSGDGAEAVGHRAGLRQRLGRDERSTGTSAGGEDPAVAFVDIMHRQGFDPTVRRRGAQLDVTLQTCPFTSAVLTDADTVCALHLGLARGFAEAVGGLVVDELMPKDPRRAHCRLRCRLVEPT